MSGKKVKNKTSVSSGDTEPVIKSIEGFVSIGKGLAELKEETMVWLLSILGAVMAYVVATFVIRKVYHPDIKSLLETARNVLISPESARPEPVEAMLFRVTVVVFTLGLLCFYVFFAKKQFVKDLSQKPIFMISSGLCVAFLVAMIYYDFAAQNPFVKDGGDVPQNSRDFVGFSNFDFYFDGIFLGNYLLLYTFILAPLISCLFFWGVKKYDWGNNQIIKRAVSVICLGVVFVIVLMCTFSFPYTFENKYDFNAVYYSMTQVYSGAPLFINGFTNTYGLYPEFLLPIFRIIGLSVLNFSLVMAILTGAAFAFNFYVLKRFTVNKFILLAGFLAVVFFPFLDFKFLTAFDSLFALFSIRYIIPSTLIFLSAIYFQKQSKVVYWLTFAVMGCFVLWNPEIGMVCYLTWVAVNTYHDFYTAEGKIALKKIGFHWLTALGIIVATAYAYKLIIYMAYGSFPDLSLLFGTIAVFGKVGFNMLPMTLVHPWNMSAIVLILGFTYSISKWYKKEATAKASMVFLLSLVGLGYFVYFQGRSHNWPFAYSTSFTLMLLTILGDELWEKINANSLLPLNALFVVFLFVISFSFFELLSGIGKINELISQDGDKAKQAEEQQHIESNADFILKNSHEKEKIYVFSAIQYQGLYFGGSKRISAYNPGFMDMFLNTDLARLVNTLADSSQNIFIEPGLCNFGYMARPLAAMAATYEVKSASGTMALLSKRTTKIPAATFFGNQDDLLIHKKYTDDTAGITARTDDALGIRPVALSPAFSVEVLFKSGTQIYPYATLAGNMNDSGGFIIANVLNSSNYFFGVNGKGFGLPVPNNEWVYCVMSVFPDHIEVFVDGNAAGSLPLASPLRQSGEKLCVGDLGYMRYYVGAIAEMAVVNKPLDKSQVAETWEKIKSGTGRN